MSIFTHSIKHIGFFTKGCALSATTVACSIGTAALAGVSGFFYLTTALNIGFTEPLFAFAILATSALGMAATDAATSAGDNFNSAFSHCNIP